MENTKSELNRFVKGWWTFTLIGILLVVFGAWTFISRTDADFVGMTTLFIFLFIINGNLEIYFALSNRRVIPSWGGMLAFGVIELLLGLMLAANPPEAVFVFQIYVGFWLLSRGMLLVLAALDLDQLGFKPDWMVFLIGGVLTTGLGIGVFLQSQVGFGTVVAWTGLAMILAGAFSVLFSFKVKKTGSKITDTARKIKDIDIIT